MAVRSIADKMIPEKATYRYTAKLSKEDGSVIAPADLTTLVLTVYNLDAALTVINSISGVNILNVGRGTLDASGNLAIVLSGLDLALVDATKEYETHVMLIEGTYASGARFTKHEVEHRVQNLAKVS